MVDITDDKHGKRDKQMQRGITLLVAAVFVIVAVLAIWQHTQHESRHLRHHKKYPGEHVKGLEHKSIKSVFTEKRSVLDKLFSNGHEGNPAAGKPPPHQHHAAFAGNVKDALSRKLNKHDIIANAEEQFKANHLERHKSAAGGGTLAYDTEGLQQRLKEKLHHHETNPEGDE
mmetsp:Transcript_5441/g.8937  ORF Transcript_5441/g.8937 Transcript_5441/m.8937 type:complete len:172 (+) Transcript_5441:138-653(+)